MKYLVIFLLVVVVCFTGIEIALISTGHEDQAVDLLKYVGGGIGAGAFLLLLLLLA